MRVVRFPLVPPAFSRGPGPLAQMPCSFQFRTRSLFSKPIDSRSYCPELRVKSSLMSIRGEGASNNLEIVWDSPAGGVQLRADWEPGSPLERPFAPIEWALWRVEPNTLSTETPPPPARSGPVCWQRAPWHRRWGIRPPAQMRRWQNSFCSIFRRLRRRIWQKNDRVTRRQSDERLLYALQYHIVPKLNNYNGNIENRLAQIDSQYWDAKKIVNKTINK